MSHTIYVPMLALCAVVLGALSGCNESPYKLAPVRGVVLLDGQPLVRGTVMFAPAVKGEGIDAGKPAFGQIQSDGSYVLSTFGKDDGAIIGDHWASIINSKSESNASVDNHGRPMPEFRRITVRKKMTVVAGQENQIEIRLTTQEIARFASH